MTNSSAAVACALASVTAVLLLFSLVWFFIHRGQTPRAFVAALPLAAVIYAVVRMAPPLMAALTELPRPSLQLAGAATILFVPLILTQALRALFFRYVGAVENLLIKATDTDEWSDQWRAHFVARHREDILSRTTAIQRDWLRTKNASIGALPLFATVVLGEPRDLISRYIASDRIEPYRQLEMARRSALEDER